MQLNPVDDAVDALLRDLEAVSSGDDVAHNASHAISRLQSSLQKPETSKINSRQRDRLLSAFMIARPSILRLFFCPAEHSHADFCLSVVAGLIWVWAESDAERAARHPHVYLDLHDYARQIRNALHNLALQEDIRRRRSERIGETVEGLLRAAIG